MHKDPLLCAQGAFAIYQILRVRYLLVHGCIGADGAIVAATVAIVLSASCVGLFAVVVVVACHMRVSYISGPCMGEK